MTNETGMDIFKAFSDLSRMDKEDFARYVVNNLANRSRERLLFYLAADFLEFIQGNNDFTTKQIKKLVSLGINLGEEWTLQNLLDCLVCLCVWTECRRQNGFGLSTRTKNMKNAWTATETIRTSLDIWPYLCSMDDGCSTSTRR